MGAVKPSSSMSEKVLNETLKYQRKVGRVDLAIIPINCNRVELLHDTIETVNHFNHINALLRLCGQSSRISTQSKDIVDGGNAIIKALIQ